MNGPSIVMMPTRLQGIFHAVYGYKKTGVFLVSWNGTGYVPSGASDDKGLYLFAQMLHTIAGVHPANIPAIFWFSFFWGSFFVALLSFIFTFKKASSRLISYFYLFLLSTALLKKVGDVYIVPACAALTLIPPFLLIMRKKNEKWLFVYMLLAGFLTAMFNFFRVFAGWGAALFLAIYLTVALFKRTIQLKKFLIASILFLSGYFIHQVPINVIISRRNAFLQNIPAVRPYLSQMRHHFWHNFYIGFGFLSNHYVPEYRDEVAIESVRKIKPHVPVASPEYSSIVKKLTLRLIKDHPVFFFKTMFAKLGVVLFFVLVFMNFSLLFLPLKMMPLEMKTAFLASSLFYASYGFVAVPMSFYLSGTIACVSMAAIFTLALPFEHFRADEIMHKLKTSYTHLLQERHAEL